MTPLNNFHHKESLDYKKIFFVDIISLLMGFTGGLLVYTMSAYFKNVWESSNIGWTFLIANIILLIILFNIHKLVHTVGRSTLFQLLTICKISVFIALVIVIGKIPETTLLILYIILEALSWAVLKMILESYVTDNESGRIYGFNLTVTNIGLILAPIAAIQLLSQFGFTGIFYFSIILNIIIFAVAFFNLRHVDTLRPQQPNYKGLFKKLQSRTDIQKIFSISFALEFFFAIMVIYTPLYLLDQGFSWSQISIIFTVMLIPLILIQYPVGLLADKKLGEKELLFIAFVLIALSSTALYFFGNTSMIIIMTILLISRIGAAFVGILRLSYFYKRIDKTDVDMIAFFQTARPLAYIIAPATASVFLIFLPMNSVFILITFIALLTLYPVYKLQDNHAQSENKTY